MLQNTRVTAFTVSVLLRENQQGGGVKLPPPPPTKIRVNAFVILHEFCQNIPFIVYTKIRLR